MASREDSSGVVEDDTMRVCHLHGANARWLARWVVVVVCWSGGGDAWAQSPAGESADPSPSSSERQRRSDDAVSGTVRVGGEYDSNALRTEVADRVDDLLLRYFAAVDAELEGSEGAEGEVRLQQGGKIFRRQKSADTLLTNASLDYRADLAERLQLGLDVSVKDRLERRPRGEDNAHQDYNRGSAGLTLVGYPGPWSLSLATGWRYFAFRPTPASSNHGPYGAFRVGLQVAPDWRLRAGYRASDRMYPSVRLVAGETDDGETVGEPASDGSRRRDLLHVGQLGVRYRGPVILDGGYRLWLNRSNSYGSELVRHGLVVDGTVPLPWRLYLSARLQLQRTRYQDAVFAVADLAVDEENRNAVVASVTRVVGDHWEIEARYRLYLEAFGASATYRRQTIFLGTGYVF